MRLQGKVAIVTGSSRGIGKAIALAYAREGAKVVLAARTEQEGGKLPGSLTATAREIQDAGGRALSVKCDVSEEEEVNSLIRKTLDAFGRIDILVNNAAVQINGAIEEIPTKRWDLGIRVNLRGPFLTCRGVLPVMMKQRSGNIINVTSRAAESTHPKAINYAVTKAGLERMTFALAEEGREYNIAVNCLDPGPVKTEGAAFVRPPDFDWTGWQPTDIVAEPAIYLALQTPATLTGKVVRVREWGKTWGR